jgi:hypothetical protein
VKLGVFLSNTRSRRAKLTADKLAARGLEWARPSQANDGAPTGDGPGAGAGFVQTRSVPVLVEVIGAGELASFLFGDLVRESSRSDLLIFS